MRPWRVKKEMESVVVVVVVVMISIVLHSHHVINPVDCVVCGLRLEQKS